MNGLKSQGISLDYVQRPPQTKQGVACILATSELSGCHRCGSWVCNLHFARCRSCIKDLPLCKVTCTLLVQMARDEAPAADLSCQKGSLSDTIQCQLLASEQLLAAVIDLISCTGKLAKLSCIDTLDDTEWLLDATTYLIILLQKSLCYWQSAHMHQHACSAGHDSNTAINKSPCIFIYGPAEAIARLALVCTL